MSTEECAVCFEKYKGKRVVKITCQYCPVNACRGCQQTYLLQSFDDPNCLQCKRGWSPEFMAANFPLSFRNGALRKHRRRILLEREKSLLPAMQVYVEYRRNISHYQTAIAAVKEVLGDPHSYSDITPENLERVSKDTAQKIMKTVAYRHGNALNLRLRDTRRITVIKKEIENLTKQSAAYQKILAEMPDTDERATTVQEVLARMRESDPALPEIQLLMAQQAIIEKKLAEGAPEFEKLDAEFRELFAAYNTATRGLWENKNLYEGSEGSGERGPRREFIMKCSDETCRGFLSSAYKCGTCEKWTCSQCLVLIGPDKDATHVCNPDTLATAKTIKAETRPCPKCGTRIFKIDGCDQMWCVMDGCNTAFSWQSGTVIVGTIHNPHYYEWLRRQGGGAPAREIGDIPCGGLPIIQQLMSYIRDSYLNHAERDALYGIHRNLRELIEMRLRDYPARQPQLMNKDADVDYLMKKISEEEWQRQLELSEAKFLRKKEIGQILQTLATAGSDMINQITSQARAASRAAAAFETAARTGRAAANDTEQDRLIRAAASAKAVTMKHDAAITFSSWFREVGMPGLEQLRVFGNDSLKNLAKRDRMAVPQFEGQWAWVPHRAIYKPKKEVVEASAAPAV